MDKEKYCILENDGVALCVCKHRPCEQLKRLQAENERLKSNKGRCAFKCLDNTFCPDADKKITELELSRDCYKVSYETAKKYREIAEKALEDIKGIVIQAEQKLHCVCDITEMLLDIEAKIDEVIGAE